MDGRLDVLGDGGGALVVAGLVPVEPPHVVRLHGAQVAPLVRQAPPPRRRRRLPSSSCYSHATIHLHHHRRQTATTRAQPGNGGNRSGRACAAPHRGKADDELRCGGGGVLPLLCLVCLCRDEAERLRGTATTPRWH